MVAQKSKLLSIHAPSKNFCSSRNSYKEFVVKRHRPCIILMLTVLFLTISYTGASGAEPYVLLYPQKDAERIIKLSVPLDGKVQLILVATNMKEFPEIFNLFLTPFVGEQGDRITVKLQLPEDSEREAGPELKDIRPKRAILPLNLEVPSLETADDYSGMLLLLVGNNVRGRWSIVLKRASISPPAVLTLDRQTVSLSLSRPVFPWWAKDHIAEFTVHLREKANEWPIKHVFIRLEEVQEINGQFDPKEKLDFKFNGTEIPDFWSWPPQEQKEVNIRNIPQGGQASVLCQLRDLEAGSYMARLRFQAANSREDDSQKLMLSIKARDSVVWALGILILASLFSYFATKGLKTLRQHLDFQKRISELRPNWLRSEASILPVVWVRSMLKQAEERSKRWIISASDVIEERINQANQLLKPLDRARKIKEALKHSGVHPMIMRRTKKAQKKAIAPMGTGPIDEKLSEQINSDLTELEGWLKSEQQLKEHYWNNLKSDISHLLDIVKMNEIPDFAKDVFTLIIQDLEDSLKPDYIPSSIKDAVEHENKYAKLKILWERRMGGEEFQELISLQKRNEPIERLFEIADKAVWERLKGATEKTGIRFISPRKESPEPFQAYQPLFFEVATGDPSLGDNYLFKHGLTYKWLFELDPHQSWLSRLIRGKKKPIKLTPESDEPRVVQYVPKPGILKASVKIYFKGEPEEQPLTCSMENLEIQKSKDFRWRRAFEAVEVTAFFLALVVAILSGLSIKYFNNPTFGAGGDYLMLFLWGAGADQTKNFVQTLQSYSVRTRNSGASG